MLKEQGKQDVYDWLVEITEPVEQKGGTPTAGSVTLMLSAIPWMSVAAINMFLFIWENRWALEYKTKSLNKQHDRVALALNLSSKLVKCEEWGFWPNLKFENLNPPDFQEEGLLTSAPPCSDISCSGFLLFIFFFYIHPEMLSVPLPRTIYWTMGYIRLDYIIPKNMHDF